MCQPDKQSKTSWAISKTAVGVGREMTWILEFFGATVNRIWPFWKTAKPCWLRLLPNYKGEGGLYGGLWGWKLHRNAKWMISNILDFVGGGGGFFQVKKMRIMMLLMLCHADMQWWQCTCGKGQHFVLGDYQHTGDLGGQFGAFLFLSRKQELEIAPIVQPCWASVGIH